MQWKYVKGKADLQENLFKHLNGEGYNGFLQELHWSIKLMVKIELNKNTTGNIT